MPQDLSKLVLDPDVTRHEFRRVASIVGWTIRGFGSDEPDEPFEEAWGTRGQRREVHFVEDPFIGLSYLLLEPADRDTVLKELDGQLHIWSTAEAIEAARNPSDSQLRAQLVRILALSAPAVQEPASLATLRAAAQDEAAEVRESVVLSSAYLPTWPAVHKLLADMAESDPVPALRADAQAMLDTLNSDPELAE
ncbi:hypothetical protein GCM10027290_63220 [Micromonospora sonneratiae]|uniref:HEAT repeat domain-containing protein n=1 Tax=Micromonospora sonneratiae TaxID=1184706 RepID=A0ABW3YKB5_9ACTN